MASDFGEAQTWQQLPKLPWLVKTEPRPRWKEQVGGFKVQKKKGNGGRKFCSGVPSMSKKTNQNTATILKTSNRVHDKSHLFPQVRHTEKTTNDEKNLQTQLLWYNRCVFFILEDLFVFFWNSESFQSCLVLHGLFVCLNAFLLLCLFVRGLEVKASPSSGMLFKCIVEVGPVFLNRKAKRVITAPSRKKAFKLGG